MKPARLAVLHALPTRAFGDRSSGAVLFSARTGMLLLALFAASVAFAQAAASAKPSVLELLVKWTPLLAQGFLFNLLISVCAMLAGTIAGVMLIAVAVGQWIARDLGSLDYAQTMRWVIPGTILVTLGVQTVLSSFFFSILGLSRR